MRIGELAGREAVFDLLAVTLSGYWSRRYGMPTTVASSAAAGGSPWYAQPLLSAIHCGRPSPAVRLFLAESFRYTDRPLRALPQWGLGTWLASAAGLRLTSRAVLWVSGPLAVRAEDLVVLPGNRRIRLFDLASGVTTAIVKDGYDRTAMTTELAVRGRGVPGPYPEIGARDAEAEWFDEPIVQGFALPRCPPWRDRARLAAAARRELAAWTARSARPSDARAHAEALLDAVRAATARIAAQDEQQRPWASRLARAAELLVAGAAALPELSVARTHGDFQPGNVLVERHTDRVLLTDWEHSRERSQGYDEWVWTLRSRFPKGFATRVKAALAGGARRSALQLFLLEETEWHAADAASALPRPAAPSALAVVEVAEMLAGASGSVA